MSLIAPMFDFGGTLNVPVSARPTLDQIQAEWVQATFDRLDSGRESTVVNAATGTGKTWFAAKLATEYCRRTGKRVLFVVDRTELLDQAVAEFRGAGLVTEIEKCEHKAHKLVFGWSAVLFGQPVQVVVASMATLQNARLAGWPPDTFGLIIFDEAHNATCSSITNIRTHFHAADFYLGLTATDYRLDGQPLYGDGAPFQDRAVRYPIDTAIRNGHLSKLDIKTLNTGIDLRGIRISRGKIRDFNAGDISDRVGPKISDMARAFVQQMDTLSIDQLILFAPCVKSAGAFADAFKLEGVAAAGVWGHTRKNPLPEQERKDRIQAFREHRLRVITNYDLATAGFNHKPTHVALATLTLSLGRITQMVGRATRIADPEHRLVRDGVPTKFILDCCWSNVGEYCTPIDIFLEDEPSPKVKSLAKKMAKVAKHYDPQELLEKAREQTERDEERERKRKADKITVEKSRRELTCRVTTFSPVTAEQILGPPPPTLAMKPTSNEPITEAQRSVLGSYGMNDTRGLSADRADWIIQECMERSLHRLAEPEQIRKLIQHGVSAPEAQKLTAKDADAKLMAVKAKPVTDAQRRWLAQHGYADTRINQMTSEQARSVMGQKFQAWRK